MIGLLLTAVGGMLSSSSSVGASGCLTPMKDVLIKASQRDMLSLFSDGDGYARAREAAKRAEERVLESGDGPLTEGPEFSKLTELYASIDAWKEMGIPSADYEELIQTAETIGQHA